MQKHKVENFQCNVCYGDQGKVLLDCFCLFCLDCWNSLDIARVYEEKQKLHKKEKLNEKCFRCSRNTDFKIYYLENKSNHDQIRFLFNNVSTSLMPVYKIFEFQLMQKNREIKYLSSTLKRICKKLSTLVKENSFLSAYFDETDFQYFNRVAKHEKEKNQNTPQNSSITNITSENTMKQKQISNKDTDTIENSKAKEVSNQVPLISDANDSIKTPQVKPKRQQDLKKFIQLSSESKQGQNNVITKEKMINQMQLNTHPVNIKNPSPVNQIFHEQIPSECLQTPIDKIKNKNVDRNAFENSFPKKNQVYHRKNEYETPVAPQLKKMKLVENSREVPHQKEDLKKLFGFELKEIKKTSSNNPSTEKPAEDSQNIQPLKLPNTNGAPKYNYMKTLQQQQNQYQNKNQYWGRGYHLNYPNYN